MFIRLKKPTFVLRGTHAQALQSEVLFNLARVGAVSFGITADEVYFSQEGKNLGILNAGDALTIQIDIDGHLNELLEQVMVERRTTLVFPPQLHGEYERIKRILEARVVES